MQLFRRFKSLFSSPTSTRRKIEFGKDEEDAKDSNKENITTIRRQNVLTSVAGPRHSSPEGVSSSGLGNSAATSRAASLGRTSSASPREIRAKRSLGERDNTDRSSTRSLKTPLSIVKVSPMSIISDQHGNKVGSSFMSDHCVQHDGQLLASSGGAPVGQAALLAGLPGNIGTTGASPGHARNLPVIPRKVRDSGSLLFMLAFLGFLGYILWDGMFVNEADISLIVHGHDSYGNICGRNNKPIRFAEKSGQNFTELTYTKYTLINSQFERYTLDSSRLKNGELVYVKEQPGLDDSHDEDGGERAQQSNHLYDPSPRAHHRPLTETSTPTTAPPSVASDSLRQKLSADRPGVSLRLPSADVAPPDVTRPLRVVFPIDRKPGAVFRPDRRQQTLRGDGNLTRFRRQTGVLRAAPQQQSSAAGASLLDDLNLAKQSRNGTLLNTIKSNLMYQYPPMYGYNNGGSVVKNTVTAYRKPQLEPNASLQHSIELMSGHDNNGPSYFRRNSSEIENDPIDARASSIDLQHSGRHLAEHSRHHHDSRQPVNNDSDRFDHTFVTPMSVLTTSGLDQRTHPFGPNGSPFISSSEAPNHLLYLTECVASCPRDHVELIFYRCMPNNWRFSLFPNAINVTRTFIDDILTDISRCYKELIYIFSLALVLSLCLLILLRFLASVIIWSCILVLISLCLSLASYAWLTFYYQVMDLNSMMPHDPSYAERLANSDKWLVGSIFLTFVAFATIGIIIFMRKRILLVTMLFRESGKAIADMPLLLLQPLLTFAALIGIMIAWSVGLVCLQSMKKPVVDFRTGFVVFKAETLYKIMKWYHVFAFLWVSHFAIACQHYVIGASVSKWYFSSNRYELSSPIGNSISELILYYLGSVALGSFLVAILKVIRIITRQIQFLIQRNCMTPGATQASNTNSVDGGAMAVPQVNSSSCCGSLGYVWRLSIWFIDNVVMVINRDAYVEIAIHGYSFLSGARRAFTVLASNPLRLLAIKSVGNFLLTIAKICVVFGTVSIAYILLEEKNQTLNYSWSPIVISGIYAYIVAHWFLSVYEMVIDALFICYCEDYEITKNQEQLERQIRGSNFMNHILNNNVASQSIY